MVLRTMLNPSIEEFCTAGLAGQRQGWETFWCTTNPCSEFERVCGTLHSHHQRRLSGADDSVGENSRRLSSWDSCRHLSSDEELRRCSCQCHGNRLLLRIQFQTKPRRRREDTPVPATRCRYSDEGIDRRAWIQSPLWRIGILRGIGSL